MPQYVIKEEHIKTSPTIFFFIFEKLLESSVHLSFSLDKPLINLFACSILCLVFKAVSSNAFFFLNIFSISKFKFSTNNCAFNKESSASANCFKASSNLPV